MVASVTSLGRSGVYDWLVQRVSAIVLAVYFVFLLGFLRSLLRLPMRSGKGCSVRAG